MTDVASLVKVIFDDESHVTKGKINEIPHQNKVVHLIIDSVAIAKFELWLKEFFHIHFVTFKFTRLLTVDDIIILS